jgi:hypothetical protein
MYNMPVFSVVPIDKWRYGRSSSAHWELHCRIQLRHLRYRSCHVDSTTQHKTLNLEGLHFWSLRTEHAYVFNPVCTFYIYRIYSRNFRPHVFFAPQIFKHFGRVFFPPYFSVFNPASWPVRMVSHSYCRSWQSVTSSVLQDCGISAVLV